MHLFGKKRRNWFRELVFRRLVMDKTSFLLLSSSLFSFLQLLMNVYHFIFQPHSRKNTQLSLPKLFTKRSFVWHQDTHVGHSACLLILTPTSCSLLIKLKNLSFFFFFFCLPSSCLMLTFGGETYCTFLVSYFTKAWSLLIILNKMLRLPSRSRFTVSC